MNVLWNQTYPIAEAERGKFVPIDPADLSTLGYPATGRGRYAELVYVAGGQVSLNGVISADLIEIENVNVSSTVSSIQMLPNTTTYQSITLSTNTSSIITFSPKVTLLEVFNDDSSNKAYLSLETTTFANLTSQGLPILPTSYYSIERDTTQAIIGSVAGATVRVIGHRRS